MRSGIYILLLLLLSGCSAKKNNFFSRQYHQLTTRYNVYFNGNEALKAGEKKMELKHKEDYTNLLPVFVSNDEQTRAMCSSDMDYAIEKAAKAIDKHSITVKPRRKKNKDSKSYETFRKKKEFNNQLSRCYILLGKAYFYKKKYTMANNTFRFIQRQYADDEEVLAEVALWLFRGTMELGRYDEAAKFMNGLNGVKLNRKQQEMYAAAKTDFYIRQGLYRNAISEAEALIASSKSMKRKPRYNFILSQLYLKENQDAQAMYVLKKAIRFNFNYEMVFNAKINMALAYQSGDESVKRDLMKMLRDVKNNDFQDRIYYALANIEEKRGEEKAAIDLYWKSVRTSVDNDNQQSLSFFQLGKYYFRERDYVTAQSCYDSCLLLMDSRYEDYEKLKGLVSDLTDLVGNLKTIQLQDSLLKLAALPESERNKLIDTRIDEIREKEAEAKEQEQKAQAERNFYDRNNMLSRGDAFSQGGSGGDWYFYNPVTISLGKNDFKRKWGRRKLEDNWRRQNKSMVDFVETGGEAVAENSGEEEKVNQDVKSRNYYLKDVPLTEEAVKISNKKVEDSYYKAGEIYLYKFSDYEKALGCFETFIHRFDTSANLPLIYYLANTTAEKLGGHAKAESYKNDLFRKFPDSDFAKGLQDPDYFKKVDGELRTIGKMYEDAYAKYQQVYYEDALSQCDEILRKYPDNKLAANVLFLRAMCIVNTRQPEEAREALNRVLEVNPEKGVREVVSNLLASISVGDKPVLYTDADMSEARGLKASRNWVFDSEGNVEKTEEEQMAYAVSKEEGHQVVILLPEDFNLIHVTKLQARLTFINAAEAVEGKKYEMKKSDLWYKMPAIVVEPFTDYKEAEGYLNRIGTDKLILKNFGNREYRMFAITGENLSRLKRLKKLEDYVNFFAGNYFEDRNQGEMITGKLGAGAHIFKYEDDERHNFVLMVPFRKINTKRIAEKLGNIERAFTLMKEDYDEENEMIVVRNVGTKAQAMDYMNTVMKDKGIFDELAGVEYHTFVITPNNLRILLDNAYLEEYLKFFNENYLKYSVDGGVEDGEFAYNKSLSHKFVLFYSNKIDPFKLKAVFEEFNFAGLTVNNQKYDDENDCMIVSGFGSKDEAMRYFNTVISNRKLFKPLKDVDYTNFVISGNNFEMMNDKKLVEKYLLFFKKYYLND